MKSLIKKIEGVVSKLIDAPKGSPHLTIYKAQVASLVSILQRISGLLVFFLILGEMLVEHFLIYGMSMFMIYKIGLKLYISGTILVQVLWWVFFISLIYHIFNGIKFFIVEYYLGSVKFENVSLTLGGYYILSFVVIVLLLLLSLWPLVKIIL